MRIWEASISSDWQAKPVWVHGDISPANLLIRNHKLTAVIDFGMLAVGDPASDFMIAWTFFDEENRNRFRKKLNIDENTWLRARGWALWKASIVASGLTKTNAFDVEKSFQIIHEILKEAIF